MSTYLETLTADIKRELVALNVPEQEAGERARTIAMDRILRDPAINADAAFNESDHPRGEGGQFGSGGGGGSKKETASQKSEGSAGGKSPSFLDYAKKHLGEKYVIARPTPNNKSRYPEHKFVTPSEHDAVKAKYRKEHPEAAEAYFGKA